MWGYQPWDNDRAADWFSKAISDSGFAENVRQTLKKGLTLEYLDDEIYSIRAACYCLLKLGYIYIWPAEHLKNDLILAIESLRKILTEDEIDEQMSILIQEEISELESRLFDLKTSF